MTRQQAFLAGLADRMAGKPMMAFGTEDDDVSELNDAYTMGYDPHHEMHMFMPEFAHKARCTTLQLIAECCPDGVPPATALPHNDCEFPGYHIQ